MSKNVKVIGKDSVGKDVTCFVRKPNSKDFREAKLYSNADVAKVINSGSFLLRSQVKDKLRENGLWGDVQEKKLLELAGKIRESEGKLTKGGLKKSEGRAIALEIADYRDEQMNLLYKLNALDDTTVEAMSENNEFDYLVSVCSLDEKGERLFKSVDDYKENGGEEPYFFSLAGELQNLVYGMRKSEDIMMERTEYKFLKQFGFINDKMQLVDKDNNLVNRDGKKVDAEGYMINENNERVDVDGNKIELEVKFGEFSDD